MLADGQCPSQLRRPIRYECSTKSRCTFGSNHPQHMYRLLAHCVALVFLVLIGPRICHACVLANLPVSSYSFSACWGASCSSTYTWSQIKLESTTAWVVAVRIILTLLTESRGNVSFNIFLQTSNVNQWVTLDLGQIALVCGLVTQGRGNIEEMYIEVRFTFSECNFCS